MGAAASDAGLEEQAACEAQAETDQQLPAETQEAFEDQQTGRIEKVRAQMKYNQDIVEASYEAAAQEAESRTLVFHVKRGAVFTRCEKTKCKVGEPCFVKDESGEWAFAGVVDSTGSPPSQPIIT